MGKTIPLTVLAIGAIAGLIFYLSADKSVTLSVADKSDIGPVRPGAEAQYVSTGQNDALQQLEKLAILIEQFQMANHDHFQQLQSSFLRTENRLKELEERLQSIENSDTYPVTEERVEENLSSSSRPQRLSDSEVGQWMDNSLTESQRNPDLTLQLIPEVEQNLKQLPGVSLDDMQCSDRFCRAAFSHATGQQPAVEKLFGQPPFMNEGFTIIQPDGRVLLYFNQPGESIDELRDEAQAWSG